MRGRFFQHSTGVSMVTHHPHHYTVGALHRLEKREGQGGRCNKQEQEQEEGVPEFGPW